MRFCFSISCVIILLISTVADAKIVFDARRDGVFGIYIMNDDGTDMTLLTDTLAPGKPRFSPDGKHIVFKRQVKLDDNQRHHLFLMNINGIGIRQLTPPPEENKGRDRDPVFSPDGKSIVFSRYERIDNQNHNWSICVMDLESGKIEKISDLEAQDLDWSPDGKQIVFGGIPVAGGAGGNLWLMDADGRNARELLPTPQGDIAISRWEPRWSPDSKKVLFTEDRDKYEVIDGVIHGIPQGYYYYIYTLRTEELQRLNIRKDFRPNSAVWMDNGKSVLFTATVRKLNQPVIGEKVDYNIYKYHIATKKTTQLIDHPGNEYALDWIDDDVLSVSPAGKKKVTWGTLKQ